MGLCGFFASSALVSLDFAASFLTPAAAEVGVFVAGVLVVGTFVAVAFTANALAEAGLEGGTFLVGGLTSFFAAAEVATFVGEVGLAAPVGFFAAELGLDADFSFVPAAAGFAFVVFSFGFSAFRG